jgi:hypothetical protein
MDPYEQKYTLIAQGTRGVKCFEKVCMTLDIEREILIA